MPGFLGRVLDGDVAVGTCFQVAAGVLATAFHVLEDVGAAVVGAVVRVDPLQAGRTAPPTWNAWIRYTIWRYWSPTIRCRPAPTTGIDERQISRGQREEPHQIIPVDLRELAKALQILVREHLRDQPSTPDLRITRSEPTQPHIRRKLPRYYYGDPDQPPRMGSAASPRCVAWKWISATTP